MSCRESKQALASRRNSQSTTGLNSLPHSAGQEESAFPGIREVLRSFGLEVRQALNQLVLITATGSAQPVAAGIDYEDWPEVIGTIAGDDTVLVICATAEKAETLKQKIEGFIG